LPAKTATTVMTTPAGCDEAIEIVAWLNWKRTQIVAVSLPLVPREAGHCPRRDAWLAALETERAARRRREQDLVEDESTRERFNR
jgi:hypothetical protein